MFVPRSPSFESVLRALLGLYALIDTLTRLVPLETNFRPYSTLSILCAVLLFIGWCDALAGLGLFLIWWLRPVPFDAWQLDAGISLLFLASLFVPRSPFGSWSVRGRLDPGEGWSLPEWIHNLRACGLFVALPMILLPAAFPLDATRNWDVLGDSVTLGGIRLGYLHLCACAALLAMFFTRRALAWWWLGMALGCVYTAFEPSKAGSWPTLAWLLVFSAPWERVPALVAAAPDRVRYDGSCGLCHGMVRFLIAEDSDGSHFCYAPLDPGARSIVVECADGRRLEASAAVLHCLRRLGGPLRLLAELLSVIPAPLRDGVYFLVARLRNALADKPKESCPALPRHLRSRFR